jgi:hypothetical protein
MNNTLVQDYERDYYAWLSTNAEHLRRGKFSDIDAEHIAEELETLGRREKRELISHLTVLLVHLLKWQFQPSRRSKSWHNTILLQRSDVNDLLEESPSLQGELDSILSRAYTRARLIAEDETGLDRTVFPETCPYSADSVLDQRFLPNDSNGDES